MSPGEGLFKNPNEFQPPYKLNPLASFLKPPESSIPTLSFLLSQRAIQKRQNLYYRDKEIQIDGYVFENCRFDNCKLITKNGTFKFIRCVFDNSTTVSYYDAALKVIKLYNRKEQQRNFKLSPELNPDSTINII